MHRSNLMLHDLYHEIGSWLRRWQHQSRALRTAEWVRVDAVIRNVQPRLVSEVFSISLGRLFEWHPVVIYEYQVENTTYSGRTSGEIWYFDEEGAFDAAKSLVGASLPVRYDPSRPSKSFYLPQDGGPPELNPALPDALTGLVVISLKK